MKYILISSGEYSDYSVIGVWAKEDYDDEEVKELRRQSIKTASDNSDMINSIIIKRLSDKGLAVYQCEHLLGKSKDYYIESNLVKQETGLSSNGVSIFVELLESNGFTECVYEEYHLDDMLD
jgi:hypothetical protein